MPLTEQEQQDLVDRALKELKPLERRGDVEAQHALADDVLLDTLQRLGLWEIVDAWKKVPKWYA